MDIGVFKKIIIGTTGYKVIRDKHYHGKFKSRIENDEINAICVYPELTIVYKNNRPQIGELLMHELGHALLHGVNYMYYYSEPLTTEQQEFEAELFSSLVCQGLGETYQGRELIVKYKVTDRLEVYDYLQYYTDEVLKDAFYLKYLDTAQRRMETNIRIISDYCKKHKIKFHLRETLRCLRHIMKYIENSKG